MDNPAAILTDDVIDWNTSASSIAGQIKNTSTNGTNNENHNPTNKAPQTPLSSSHHPPQQHYRRNASTYSLDIPATMGLMVTNSIPAVNGGSTIPST